jgi:hypothetical protein
MTSLSFGAAAPPPAPGISRYSPEMFVSVPGVERILSLLYLEQQHHHLHLEYQGTAMNCLTVYLEASVSCNDLSFIWSSTTTTRTWNIKVQP